MRRLVEVLVYEKVVLLIEQTVGAVEGFAACSKSCSKQMHAKLLEKMAGDCS